MHITFKTELLPLLFPSSLEGIVHAFLFFSPGSPGMILRPEYFPITSPHAQFPTLTDGLIGLVWGLKEVRTMVSFKHLPKLYTLSMKVSCPHHHRHCHHHQITLSRICPQLVLMSHLNYSQPWAPTCFPQFRASPLFCPPHLEPLEWSSTTESSPLLENKQTNEQNEENSLGTSCQLISLSEPFTTLLHRKEEIHFICSLFWECTTDLCWLVLGH